MYPLFLPWTRVGIASLVYCRVLVARFLHLVAREALRWLRVIGGGHCGVGVVATRGCVVVGDSLRGRGHSPDSGYN